MRKLLVAAAAAAWISMTAGGAQAQGVPYGPLGQQPLYNGFNRPALSPYLNMLRGGDPASNFYLGVIPEFQRRNFEARALDSFQSLSRDAARNRELAEDALAREPTLRTLPSTGHPTAFLNYGSYFGTLNRR